MWRHFVLRLWRKKGAWDNEMSSVRDCSLSTAGLQLDYSLSTACLQLGYSLSTAGLQLVYSWTTVCPQLVYRWTTAGLQLVYSLSRACLQLDYSLSTACLQLDYNLSTACLELVYSWTTACPQLGYRWNTAGLQLVYSLSRAYLQLDYSLSTAGLQLAYSLSTAGLQLVYSLSTACLQLDYSSLLGCRHRARCWFGRSHIQRCKVVRLHALKIYTGSRITATFVLNLDTKWIWMVGLTPRPLFPLYTSSRKLAVPSPEAVMMFCRRTATALLQTDWRKWRSHTAVCFCPVKNASTWITAKITGACSASVANGCLL